MKTDNTVRQFPPACPRTAHVSFSQNSVGIYLSCVWMCTSPSRHNMQSETRKEINCGSLYRSTCLGSYKITALAGEVDWSRRGGGEFYDLVNQREFVNASSERKQRKRRLLSVGRGESWGMSVQGRELTGWETLPLRLSQAVRAK